MASPDDSAQNPMALERIGDRELAVTRTFDAPPPIVFKAWSQAELFRRWWLPRSVTGIALVGCDMDVQTGGTYRLEFGTDGPETMVFYGKYLDVVPHQRIVWTNDEDEAGAVSTVTFTELGGRFGALTQVTFHEAYPTVAALEAALQGSAAGLPEQFDQLAEVLADIGESGVFQLR